MATDRQPRKFYNGLCASCWRKGCQSIHLKLFGFPPCPLENYGPNYGIKPGQVPRSVTSRNVANVRQFTTLCCRAGYTGETNFRAQCNHREAVGVYFRVDPAASVVENSMLELATVFIAAFSASMFLAHAIEAYLAQ
jgi:hypothetical protein